MRYCVCPDGRLFFIHMLPVGAPTQITLLPPVACLSSSQGIFLKIASCTFQNGHNGAIHKKIVQNSLSMMKKIENMIVKLDI